MEITLEITRRCPLNCRMCSSNGGTNQPDELPERRWFDIVSQASEIGFGTVNISGGEPFTSSFLIDLADHAKSLGLEVVVYTSGNANSEDGKRVVPIDGTQMRRLSKSVTRVAFNVQGPSSQTHDSLTCTPGSFDNLLASIMRTGEAGLCCTGHFVPTRLNYWLLPETVETSIRLGLSRLGILRFVPQGRGLANQELLGMTNKDMSEFGDILASLPLEYRNHIRLGAPFADLGLRTDAFCSLGSRLTVMPDGTISPCEAFKDYSRSHRGCNLSTTSLAEAWRACVLCNPFLGELLAQAAARKVSMACPAQSMFCPQLQPLQDSENDMHPELGGGS